MTCEEIREKLSEYLDGECEKSEEVAKHLDTCAECQKEFERLVTLSKSFKDFVKAPEKSLADSVVGTIRQEKMKKTPFFVRHIGLAASLVLILFLVLYTRLFPYGAKEESAEIGEGAGETVTLEAEILDIKNSATLKDDVHFAVVEDMSPRDEIQAEEAAPEESKKSEPVTESLKEAPLSPSPDGSSENTEQITGFYAFKILLSSFHVTKIDETTLEVLTDDVEGVRKLLEGKIPSFTLTEKDGVVVVKIK